MFVGTQAHLQKKFCGAIVHGMKKADVIEHFGSVRKAAEALDCTTQYVYMWDEFVPEGIAYKLQVMTGGKLRADPAVYKPQQPRPGYTPRRTVRG